MPSVALYTFALYRTDDLALMRGGGLIAALLRSSELVFLLHVLHDFCKGLLAVKAYYSVPIFGPVGLGGPFCGHCV